jgi:hypothetical protein
MSVRLATLVAALWWGGISALAFVAVPALFAQLGSPAVAGPVAAWLFAFVCRLTWASSAACLLFWMKNNHSPQFGYRKFAIAVVVFAAVCALFQDLFVAQRIVSARATGGDLRMWHTLGSALVLAQWAAAGISLWWLTGQRAAGASTPELAAH